MLLHSINPAQQVGVEIGPLTNPIVTRDMGLIYYVDHASTADLQAKYANDPATDISKIVAVDYVWGEKSLTELTQDQQPFDYLIASHVIEHVPDLIGWLGEIRAILKPGGVLSLAIPDKRHCFDYKRHTTRTCDVFEAYLHRRKRPSPRQIFDYVASAVSYQGGLTWSEAVDDAVKLTHYHSLHDAQAIAKSAFESQAYHDIHCWVFTPSSFFKLLDEIAALGLLKFEVVQLYETEGCEFFVSLRAVDHPVYPSLIQPQPEVSKTLSKVLVEENKVLQEQLQGKHLEQQAIEKKAEQERQEYEQARSHLQACIKAMESSKFWQMRMLWLKLKQALGLL